MITDFKRWLEVTKGVYRYVIAAGACYEIHINYWDHETDILTANASLYIAGDWSSKTNKSFFERELLLESNTVQECLSAADKDYRENM